MPEGKRSFTDAGSRIMPGPGRARLPGILQPVGGGGQRPPGNYGARFTNQASDKQQAVATLEQAIGNPGTVPREVSADAGYCSVKKSTDLMPGASTRSSHGRGLGAADAADEARPGALTPR